MTLVLDHLKHLVSTNSGNTWEAQLSDVELNDLIARNTSKSAYNLAIQPYHAEFGDFKSYFVRNTLGNRYFIHPDKTILLKNGVKIETGFTIDPVRNQVTFSVSQTSIDSFVINTYPVDLYNSAADALEMILADKVKLASLQASAGSADIDFRALARNVRRRIAILRLPITVKEEGYPR